MIGPEVRVWHPSRHLPFPFPTNLSCSRTGKPVAHSIPGTKGQSGLNPGPPTPKTPQAGCSNDVETLEPATPTTQTLPQLTMGPGLSGPAKGVDGRVGCVSGNRGRVPRTQAAPGGAHEQ